MTWCDTLLEAAIRWWEHCSHKRTTSCAHDYNQKPYSGKALASTQYSLAMNEPKACQENINNTITPHHRGFNDWLFELLLRSYQIEAVWPLFSDLRHQQGIFAQTAAHWIFYIQTCHSKFLKSLKHTHTLMLTLNFCRSFWSCLKCLNALSSLQLYWQTKILHYLAAEQVQWVYIITELQDGKVCVGCYWPSQKIPKKVRLHAYMERPILEHCCMAVSVDSKK